jgi:hypothetical protein
MRWGTRFLISGVLLLAACTRTVIVQPGPERQVRGSRPPPRTAPEPDRPPPPPVRTYEVLIPPGHLPNPGECRVWIPGRAPGRQPRPRSRPCAGIEAVAPAGSWIVYRRADDPSWVYLRVIDERRPGIVIRNRIFDANSWELIREEDPQVEARGNGRPPQERPRDQQERPREQQERPREQPANPPPFVQPPGYRPPEPQPPPPDVQVRPPAERPTLPRPEVIPPVQPPPAQPPPGQQPPPVQPPPTQPPPGQQPPGQQPPPVQPPPVQPPPTQPPPPAQPTGSLTLDIPPGHLPEIGECRVWIPGVPPGRQARPKSRSCDGIVSVAPAGSWVIDRPRAEPKLVYVRIVDSRRAGVLVLIRVFDLDTKRLLREVNP